MKLNCKRIDFTYDILWNDLPREVQGQLMNEDETL